MKKVEPFLVSALVDFPDDCSCMAFTEDMLALMGLALPHSAFRGQTPDEMYFGTGDPIPDKLDAAKKDAR
jgi:hypothetical protein